MTQSPKDLPLLRYPAVSKNVRDAILESWGYLTNSHFKESRRIIRELGRANDFIVFEVDAKDARNVYFEGSLEPYFTVKYDKIQKSLDRLYESAGIDHYSVFTLTNAFLEMIRNLAYHTERGFVIVRPIKSGKNRGVEMIALDRAKKGNEFDIVEWLNRDLAYEASQHGIKVMKFAAHELHGYSLVGKGTMVRLVRWGADSPWAREAESKKKLTGIEGIFPLYIAGFGLIGLLGIFTMRPLWKGVSPRIANLTVAGGSDTRSGRFDATPAYAFAGLGFLVLPFALGMLRNGETRLNLFDTSNFDLSLLETEDRKKIHTLDSIQREMRNLEHIINDIEIIESIIIAHLNEPPHTNANQSLLSYEQSLKMLEGMLFYLSIERIKDFS